MPEPNKPGATLVARKIDFDKAAADPSAWRSVAFSLLFSAKELWDEIRQGLEEFEANGVEKLSERGSQQLRMRGPFYLLAGLAIENMLKAVIVKRMSDAKKPVTEGDALRIYRGNHDLVGISQQAKVPLSDDERQLLARMSTFVLWAGRYPVANTKEITAQERVTMSGDWGRISALIGRVDKDVGV